MRNLTKYIGVLLTLVNLLVLPAPMAFAQSSSGQLGETPVQSILPNGGFEYGKSKWTATGGTFSIVTSGANLGLGKSGATFDSAGAGQILRADLIPVPNSLAGKNGLLTCSIKVPSGTASHLLRVTDGTNTLQQLTIPSGVSFLPVELNFVFPGSGNIRPEIVSVASDEPLIAIDDCYIGKAYNVTQQINLPVGTVFPVAMPTCPVGSLIADGVAVSRTSYADLFSAIGTAHGTGDGSTTFHKPDYRGRFLRGVADTATTDPDKTTRTAMNTGGNTGNNVGSVQGQSFQTHTHIQNAHEHDQNSRFVNNGTAYSAGSHSETQWVSNGIVSSQTGTVQTNTAGLPFTAVNQSTGSDTSAALPGGVGTHAQASTLETRPVNAYVTYCIQHAPSVTVYKPENIIDSTGTVITVAMNSCPANSLEAAGTAVSRTTYAKLFSKMGTIHGTGDGSTTFNLPDYRGRFLRGHANGSSLDPDRASRTAMASGGQVGDNVGSVQGQAFQTHNHIQDAHGHFVNNSDTAGGTSLRYSANSSAYIQGTQANTGSTTTFYAKETVATNQAAQATGSNVQATSNETRPVNASVKYCVIFDGTVQAPQVIGGFYPGMVVPTASANCPNGFLRADGTAISRSDYAMLFAEIGISHGQGNGSTTFNLPDYRGRFLRGVDGGIGRDPDAASRTAMNTGGNTGNNVGSVQGQAFQTHTHIQDSHQHATRNVNQVGTGGGIYTSGTNTLGTIQSAPSGFNTDFTIATNQNAVATGTHAQATANETRPVNANVNYCVRY